MITEHAFFALLKPETQLFLSDQASRLHLSFQDCRLTNEIALDLQMWGEKPISEVWPDDGALPVAGKARKKKVMQLIRNHWEALKVKSNQYPEASQASKVSAASLPQTIEKLHLGLGSCPVASPRTRCCNLQTLDAVDNCGYGCSYCSIQSFFDGKQISFDQGFADKLNQLQLDPSKTYHIGTGQSSDSLMWGNSHGVLDAVIKFARDHPNVILELKTKSANVSHLLRVGPPKNMLFTWSLNTPTLIQHEEHGTASLDKRLAAAKKMADAGYVVGFHFHPIIHYQGWREDYGALIQQLISMFDPSDVALVSMGTLTYIKSVMRDIRQRAINSQILKMPLVDAEGKYSYPDDIKLDLFRHLYSAFSSEWKADVFYYLCMENQRLWQPIFGYEYDTNLAFETAMKTAYLRKICAHS